jgi:phosphopantothenoylcysteine decarboxylase/phosphopantothenate--cysteine ligase
MRVLVTLGPTYESLDEVRRLTNFSTGTLGTQLGNHFFENGHEVIALRGYYATCPQALKMKDVREFTTTENLLGQLRHCSAQSYDALFHAAAVSDFRFGQVFEKHADGRLEPLSSGKFSTRSGVLVTELVPTPKIISELRGFFPKTKIFGWKYEVDGGQAGVLSAGKKQLLANNTDYCVVNGRAYGSGFGVLARDGSLEHAPDAAVLCQTLLRLASNP